MNGSASPSPSNETRLFTRYQRGPVLLRVWNRLRSEFGALSLRMRGARIGRRVHVGRDPQLYGLHGLSIGDGVDIGRRARIETHQTERGQGQFTIGPGTHIGNDFHGGAALRVLIGRNCMFASGCTILDHDHDFSDPFDAHQAREGVVAAATVIEDSVFLGERVVVLKGVRIGNGCVVGANSVVTQDLPPLTMAAGAPARPVRRYDERTGRWERLAAIEPARIPTPGALR